MAQKDNNLFVQFRSAAIQAFEYSYEMCVKMIKRQLETMSPSAEDIEHLGYRDLIRVAAEKGLVSNPEAWFKFRDKRNKTTHTYDETKAKDVYGILPLFLDETKHLLARLRKFS